LGNIGRGHSAPGFERSPWRAVQILMDAPIYRPEQTDRHMCRRHSNRLPRVGLEAPLIGGGCRGINL
jgi:hypothetical protein